MNEGRFILIENGILVGPNHDSVRKDVLVQDDRIAAIEDRIEQKQHYSIIDAEGMIVAPGFINIHSHCDYYLPIPEHSKLYERLLFQGITTNVGGNCGFSFFPIHQNRLSELQDYHGAFLYKDFSISWRKAAEFFCSIKDRMLFNYIPLVGHGSLRVNSAGFSRELSHDQKAGIKTMLHEALDGGCYGLSTGLMYMPGTYSTTEEIVELARVTAEYPNTIYTTHLRGYSATFIKAVKESIAIGQESGLPVQISHLGPFGVKNGDKIEKVIRLMRDAQERGIDVAFDTLSYCGSDCLGITLFPPWSYSSGKEKFLQNLKKDTFWEKVRNAIQTYIPQWPSWTGGGWTDNFFECCGMENIYILGAQNSDLIGKTFVDIGKERGVDPWQALREVTIEENALFNTFINGIGGDNYEDSSSDNFDKMIENPLCFHAVDAVFDREGRSWLEAYGSFPRIIDQYVKKKKTLTLQEVIVRFTGKVASRFHITNRGYLKPGCFADIVVFDFGKMQDNPVLFTGKPQYSSGVAYLLINGEPVIDKGSLRQVLPGRVIINSL